MTSLPLAQNARRLTRHSPESVDLLLADYAGHAFTFDLARHVRAGGINVAYSYCATALSPKSDFATHERLEVYPVSSGRNFEKYRLFRRIWSETRYGVASARILARLRPNTLVVCNMPLLSLFVLWIVVRIQRCSLVIWLQDVQGGLAGALLGERHLAARVLTWIEGFLLARADGVIAISDALAAEAIRLGARPSRVSMMENWAPLELLPSRPKGNPWALRHGLAECEVFLYSGTLARKHSPDLLLELADSVYARGAQVVVVSEGTGSEWLKEQLCQTPRPNLLVLPYQPFAEVPNVLATADVLISLLDRSAAAFSVPSKTLAYLCAGRAIVASMPLANAGADLIHRRSGAGVVVDPSDRTGFISEAIRLMEDRPLREQMGMAGRSWADAHFSSNVICRRFLEVAGCETRRDAR